MTEGAFTLAEWSALEEEWSSEPQRRVNRIRVLGYLEICHRRREAATRTLDAAVEALQRARTGAELAHARLTEALNDEETMMRVVARNEPDEFARIAVALEALE